MAISSTKPITILDAVESVLVAQALQLLGREELDGRANGGNLEHLRPIIDKLRETGEARAVSPRGQKVGDSVDSGFDVFVTTTEAAKRTGLSVRGVTRAIASGELKGRRFGQRSWQISVTSVDGYNERHKRKGGG